MHSQSNRQTKTGLITGFTHPYPHPGSSCSAALSWLSENANVGQYTSWHTGWILMWADGRISSAVPQPAWHFLSLLPSVSPSRFCAHGGQWLRCALLLLSGVCTALVVDQRVLEGSELSVCLNIYGYWKMSTKHSAVWC